MSPVSAFLLSTRNKDRPGGVGGTRPVSTLRSRQIPLSATTALLGGARRVTATEETIHKFNISNAGRGNFFRTDIGSVGFNFGQNRGSFFPKTSSPVTFTQSGFAQISDVKIAGTGNVGSGNVFFKRTISRGNAFRTASPAIKKAGSFGFSAETQSGIPSVTSGGFGTPSSIPSTVAKTDAVRNTNLIQKRKAKLGQASNILFGENKEQANILKRKLGGSISG